MDTSNLHLSYYTDTLTFTKQVLITGADPTHTVDFKKFGGVFNNYVDGERRGWLFGLSMEPYLKQYIETGEAKPPKKKPTRKRKGTVDYGICHLCKNGAYLEAAVKKYIRFYAGGLPTKVTTQLLDNEYRGQISAAFEDHSFICVDCLSKNRAYFS